MARQPNILVRSVAGLGLSIQSKLLIAFVGITCLLVALSLFGLYSLQQANARTKALIRDQERIEYFNQVHSDVGDLIVLTLGQYTPGAAGCPSPVNLGHYYGLRWGTKDGSETVFGRRHPEAVT